MQNVLILWDIDGTLISLPEVSSSRHLESVEMFTKRQLNYRGPNFGKTDIGIMRDIFEFNRIEYDKKDFEKCLEILNQKSLNEIKDIEYKLNPGIRKSLDYCIKRGAVNSILTGNTKLRANHKINIHSLALKFDLCFGFFGDSHFTRLELVKFAKYKCKKLGVNRLILIGDTQIDIDSAQKNSLEIVAVSTGKNSYIELSKLSPNLLLGDFEKDFKVFQKFVDDLTKN
jgi:phosphoglycolate phosphatase-like HAD superfamily hydrolase